MLLFFVRNQTCFAIKREEDWVISINSKEPNSCWNIFEEMEASQNPELTLREIATELFAEVEEKATQPFFPSGSQRYLLPDMPVHV